MKKGITFHNGKELTADDVMYTFNRISNPKTPFQGASGLAFLNLAAMTKRDKYTVTIPGHQPYFSFPDTLRDWFYMIVPVGYDPKHPVGTGPFKFKELHARPTERLRAQRELLEPSAPRTLTSSQSSTSPT